MQKVAFVLHENCKLFAFIHTKSHLHELEKIIKVNYLGTYSKKTMKNWLTLKFHPKNVHKL